MDKVSRCLWGRMCKAELSVRVLALLFVVVFIVALSFCQLAFWSMGIVGGKPVYTMLMLVPLFTGAFVFGPYTGCLLGLLAGSVLFAHKAVFPLDFYEIFFMTPLNTFVLFTVSGLAAGALFGLVVSRCSSKRARVAGIVAVCATVSLCASLLVILNLHFAYGPQAQTSSFRQLLFASPAGVALQVLADTVCTAIACCIADAVFDAVFVKSGERTLLSVFRSWMLLVSAIVFMATSAAVFSTTTAIDRRTSHENMLSEVAYLQRQIEVGGGAVGFLLDGYGVELDGWVVVVDYDGRVVSSDDPELFPVGGRFSDAIGYAAYGRVSAREILDAAIEEEPNLSVVTMANDIARPMEFSLITAGAFDGGYIVLIRSTDMVFAGRLEAMVSTTLLAALLIAAMGVLATTLLNRVVVRRIDETNDSLGRITEGNLNERVNVRDSREFVSLSTGINSTVSALKDTIDEVEQRNAQELVTAKAIQESALPREFPPFPEIDRFDIYASMKTAKEVGGDFYDFFLIEEDRLGFVMADVSGKGIPAALFMMTAKTQIRTYMEAGLDVGEAIDAANHQLCIGNDAGMFVTVYACVLDYRSGALTYVNAGHNPPLVLRDGAWEWMREVSGMPLGLFDGISYEQFERQLQTGDMLYLYTDGVTEAMDSHGAMFGEERLEATLYKYADMNPRSVGVGVRRAITDFTLDCEQSDDITMLLLKYGVAPERKAVMILPAVTDQLVHVFNFIHEELKRRNAPKSVYNPLDIAAEELFVNVCRYAYPEATADDPGEVRIGFEYDSNPPTLTVSIGDDGVPYNPLDKPDAVTPDDIMEVPIGGLGILMAKRSVDSMDYERSGSSNIVTFKKSW